MTCFHKAELKHSFHFYFRVFEFSDIVGYMERVLAVGVA
jgi:hypothetical protein